MFAALYIERANSAKGCGTGSISNSIRTAFQLDRGQNYPCCQNRRKTNQASTHLWGGIARFRTLGGWEERIYPTSTQSDFKLEWQLSGWLDVVFDGGISRRYFKLCFRRPENFATIWGLRFSIGSHQVANAGHSVEWSNGNGYKCKRNDYMGTCQDCWGNSKIIGVNLAIIGACSRCR